MEINFLKMQALGNDYIFFNCLKYFQPNSAIIPALAKTICHRSYGVGSEGLALICPGQAEKLKMGLFDINGLEIEFNTTAIICLGRYAFDSGLEINKKFSLETKKGSTKIEIIDSRNIRVDLGIPRYTSSLEQIKERPDEKINESIAINNKEVTFTPLYINNPHLVLFVTDYNLNLHRLAKQIERHSVMGNGIDIEFIRIFSREEIQSRVWQHGKGEVLANGSAAAAAVVASVLNGFSDREVIVHLKGGDFFIEWSEYDNHLYATGPADYVFSGLYEYDEGNYKKDKAE